MCLQENDENRNENDDMIEAIQKALLEEGDVLHDAMMLEKDEKSS